MIDMKHGLNYDPFLKEYNKKISNIKKDRQEKLDLIGSIPAKRKQLNIVKKTKEKPQKGDVFVIEPIKGEYYYGIVLEANILSTKKWINNTNIIVIFNVKTRELDMKNYNPDFRNLIVRLSCVDNSYWEKGYFYKVGEDHATNLKYGFFEFNKDCNGGYFIDYNGNYLQYIPEIYNRLAIKTDIGIALESLWNLYLDGKNDKLNAFIEKEVSLVKKNKNYFKYINEEEYCGVSIDADTEKINKLSKYISNKNNIDILLNGYNLEILIETILKKEKPELIDGLKTDPEASLYFAYYASSKDSEEKSKILFKTIKKYLENRSNLNNFIQKYKNDIKWE